MLPAKEDDEKKLIFSFHSSLSFENYFSLLIFIVPYDTRKTNESIK